MKVTDCGGLEPGERDGRANRPKHDENEFPFLQTLAAFPMDKQETIAGEFPHLQILLIVIDILIN